ncbi:MAG: hypothetical protein FJW26_00530 [Acidimicrobiia bacterium]|nr:hypothetical protein [Acidimicrobiia bacterium]
MRNTDVYFPILLGLALFLIAVFVVAFFRNRWRAGLKQRRGHKVDAKEEFYCVRSSLKQINESFHVAQIVFTNRKDCTLTAQGEVRCLSADE